LAKKEPNRPTKIPTGRQCFPGTDRILIGSALDGRLDPDPHPEGEFGSRRPKKAKIKKKTQIKNSRLSTKNINVM
jgi:hypothetical protein